MAFRDDGVFEAGRADGVVLVHDTVVEDAESDGEAGLAQQGSFDGCVTASSLGLSAEWLSNAFVDPFRAGAVADRFSSLVGLVEVFHSTEPGCVDRGLQVLGPGVVRVGVALGGAVGQVPGRRCA